MVNIHYDGTNCIAMRSKIVADVEDLNPSEVLNQEKKWVGQLDGSLEFVLEAKVNESTSDIEYRVANYCSLFLKK
ncbi:hypothetical protein [Wolbachia endosymbiont of Wuchereria bancrofti]|uniref:hypothetical protein n=1 Tax=Wolbachia endosymbiont of Wuchereria bancrofti TaxID=96496 RepID=UPI000345471B|nr:hypothetical protein [Wolbachia endosymbiont of Wuchereria bancrofti]